MPQGGKIPCAARPHLVIRFLIFLSLFSAPVDGAAQIPLPEFLSPVESRESVFVDADTIEFEGDHYRAVGSVSIRQGSRSLRSDFISLDRQSGEVTATGDVRFIDGENVLTTEKFEWNLKSQKASLYDGKIFLKEDNYHIQGNLIRREAIDRYVIDTAIFTTCDGISPTWDFRGKNIQVKLNHFLTAQNAIFAVKGVPVFYLPYIWLPIQQTRQTGFLIPRIGYNTEEGLKVNNAFFWAIRSNQDATFYADYYGEKGLGGGLEYRYILSRDTRGQFNGYYLRDRQVDRNRWFTKIRHVQQMRDQTTLQLRLTALSDKNIYKDISEETSTRLLRSQDSDIYATHRWEAASAHVWAQYTQNLVGQTHDVFQRLPEAGLVISERRLIHLPIFYSLQSSVVRWENQDSDVTRIHLSPEISGRFPVGPVGVIPRVSLQHIYYALPSGEKDSQRTLRSISTDVELKAHRTFHQTLLHVVEPTLRLEQTDIRTWGTDPPLLDLMEAVSEKSRLTLILLNRWLSTGPPALLLPGVSPLPREMVYLRLSQGYRLSDHDTSPTAGTGRAEPLRLEMILYPRPSFSLDIDGQYSHDDNRLASLDTDLHWQWGYGQFEIGQRYTQDSAIRFLTGGAGFTLRNFQGNIKTWYDAEDQILRESRASLGYTFQCWGITLSHIYRPEETQFSVLFTLKGVGSLGG